MIFIPQSISPHRLKTIETIGDKVEVINLK